MNFACANTLIATAKYMITIVSFADLVTTVISMSKLFLTDPDNQSDENRPAKKPSGSASIRFKERVALELQILGVPKGAAEIAVIDLRSMYIPYYHKKASPAEAALNMLTRVTTLYKTDKVWHYA